MLKELNESKLGALLHKKKIPSFCLHKPFFQIDYSGCQVTPHLFEFKFLLPYCFVLIKKRLQHHY